MSNRLNVTSKFPGSETVYEKKSKPNVYLYVEAKKSLQNLSHKHVFPTPPSPKTTALTYLVLVTPPSSELD